MKTYPKLFEKYWKNADTYVGVIDWWQAREIKHLAYKAWAKGRDQGHRERSGTTIYRRREEPASNG